MVTRDVAPTIAVRVYEFGIVESFILYNEMNCIHCNLFLNSAFQKIDFESMAVFSIFRYLLVQFRKCMIFEFMEIRFDFRKNSFSKRWKVNPDYE